MTLINKISSLPFSFKATDQIQLSLIKIRCSDRQVVGKLI